MTITIGLMDGRKVTFGRDMATIGCGPGADVIIESSELQPIHATVSKVAGRWMAESAGDWPLQIGDGVPGRKLWLRSGDVLYLTESGVRLTFEPQMPLEPVPRSRESEQADKLLPMDDSEPTIEEDIQQRPPLHHSPAREAVSFRGRGTVMIGKGSVTFTGQRVLGTGQTKAGSFIIPLTDVENVSSEKQWVYVSIKQNKTLMALGFDAASAAEARQITTLLERDELNEMQRKRIEASGRSVLIDHTPPRCFVVAYLSDLPDGKQ